MSSLECANCGSSFSTRFTLIRHFENFGENRWESRSKGRRTTTSGINLNIPEHKNFTSESDFTFWRLDIEKETYSRFVQKRGDYETDDGVTKYFVCSRSGTYKSGVTDRKKRLKSQGTAKNDGKCPAHITSRIAKSGNVAVSHVLKHNHPIWNCNIYAYRSL